MHRPGIRGIDRQAPLSNGILYTQGSDWRHTLSLIFLDLGGIDKHPVLRDVTQDKGAKLTNRLKVLDRGAYREILWVQPPLSGVPLLLSIFFLFVFTILYFACFLLFCSSLVGDWQRLQWHSVRL